MGQLYEKNRAAELSFAAFLRSRIPNVHDANRAVLHMEEDAQRPYKQDSLTIRARFTLVFGVALQCLVDLIGRRCDRPAKR